MKNNKIFTYEIVWDYVRTRPLREGEIAFDENDKNHHVQVFKKTISFFDCYVSTVTKWGADFKNEHEIKQAIARNYLDATGKILRTDNITRMDIRRKI